MKTYYDINEFHIKIDQKIIPKKKDHTDYARFLQEQHNGDAVLIDYIPTWNEIKIKRDLLLQQSDWAAFPDATPKPSKEAWLNYRQALRNIPQNFSKPQEVIWPTIPQ